MIIPKSFFREGINDCQSFRYINAFYNFYFIIEDLYGNGKNKNAAVMHELETSEDFKSFVQWMLEDIRAHRKHYKNINIHLKEMHENYDVEGIIHLLVHMRGRLHHFSGKSSLLQGNPFNQNTFQTIAYLAMGLAVKSILQKILKIKQANE
jgi:hypothetical protein